MRDDPSDLYLGILTSLGHALPASADIGEAAAAVVRAVSALHVAAVVVAVDGDLGEVIAVDVCQGLEMRLTPALASRLMGMRMPVAGVESLQAPVSLRRPYWGFAGGRETLRQLAGDSSLADALPLVSDHLPEVAVPVMVRDRVVAVLGTWGPGCSPDMAPTLEAVAAMLAGAWGRVEQPTVGRFAAFAGPRPTTQMRKAVDGLLHEGGIVAALQPIRRLQNASVIGYEALARFAPRTHLKSPDDLFAAATLLGMQTEVDLACVRAALREAPRFNGADLFVNVLIGTLLDPRGMATLDEAVRHAGVDPGSVVIEFSEREPVPDLARLQRIAAGLRSRGFRIAVDDAGAGHASMRVIAELRPEFIKVDRSLIHSISSDRARSALVVALLGFSGHIGARLVAEGIETEAEEKSLQSLGVMFGQGWRTGRPVLCRPVDGHSTVELVDESWLARQRVSPTRVVLAPRTGSPNALPPTAAAMVRSPRRGSGLARALSDAAQALQSEHDPMRIVSVMAEMLIRVVPVTEIAIYAADYETHRMVPMFATGPDQREILADSFSMDAGVTGWAFARGLAENIDDTAEHPAARQVPGTPVVLESMLLIPLIAGEHRLGIINCWRHGVGRFTSRELEAASLFAHIAAAAWRNAQLYAELLSAAMTDPLTRLYNSRWLRDTGEREIAQAMREGRPAAMLLIDLDHFKKVNDCAGHAAGDVVLQRLASRLRACVRGGDAVVRVGGEEFVALLKDCDDDGAMVVAEAIRATVLEIPLPENCDLNRLTASIGIALLPDHGPDLDRMMGAADRAMYAAKRAGRDQVVCTARVRTGSRWAPQASRRRAPTAVRPPVSAAV